MPYKILFTPHAKKTIQKLPDEIKSRIETALLRIQTRPFDFVEKMTNLPYFKFRVGEYRLILDIRDKELIILVVAVGHRRNIYKRIK
ncbi:MAG: type II toxin-antitoxin system RelE/ParE family toxin [Candidatus Heimdallarchaeota archaeon]|nr:type II toxin-antitoxin system RelE/ParE family toxin [Candidatus Heimdallarchaeota archaeon]MCK5049145.1 type II toxin-antitoxin system RelE/ParE family toxin [Candidatus Heimdallarchaeota archaeon]